MSDAAVAAAPEASAAPPPAAVAGNTLLTAGYEAPPPPVAADSKDGIAQATQAASRPEHIPEKFWDPEKKLARTDDLAKAYTNLEKIMGSSDKIIVPKADDDTEGWDRVYKSLGRPDTADAYEFQRPDKLPEGLQYDEDLEKNWRQVAHQNGLNARQARSIYETYVKHQVDRQGAWVTHQQQTRAQGEAALRRELGSQFEGSMQAARMALRTYADPSYIEHLERTGQGNDPAVLRAWMKVGREMGGERQLKGKPAETSAADGQRTIAEFRNKYQKELFDNAHPDHKARVTELQKLYEATYTS